MTFLRPLLPLLVLSCGIAAPAAEWTIPAAGNAYRTAPEPGEDGILRRGGGIAWGDAEGVFSLFFHTSGPATLELAITARVPEGRSTLAARVLEHQFSSDLEGAEFARHPLGSVAVPAAGYVRVDLQGVERAGRVFAEIRELLVTSDTDGLTLDYVMSNQGNMFYWGRRGPSVHLSYQVPRERPLQYAYSEITVPEGEDPVGSYFMANGFGEGYFGMQVNSHTERRVLFSVWSPFQTDNPRDIPEDERVVAIGSGPDVRVGEFGNEGSGGQSFLVYPWQAGRTYRFLTEVTPDGQGNTRYTSWFGEVNVGPWRLIASFRRPKTDTHLRGFHSFLESFVPSTGFIGRRGLHGNVWVRDIDGHWHEVTQARFSVDPTGRGRHRLDFTGGTHGEHFYLRNCGFFHETGRPGDVFTRPSTASLQPDIDFNQLPR